MIKLYLVHCFYLLTTIVYSQGEKIKTKTIIVKYSKEFNCRDLCNEGNKHYGAVVMEFDVIKKNQQKKYGKKIYVIGLCRIDCDTKKDSEEEWTLEFTEVQPDWTREKKQVVVLNKELLKKNIKNKTYYIDDIRREIWTQ